MTLEEELIAFLDLDERRSGRGRLATTPLRPLNEEEIAIQRRDTSIVLDWFGFGPLFWPTLEEVGQRHGLKNRERVRQIIERRYTNRLPGVPFPAAEKAEAVLVSRDFWIESDFLAALRDHGLVGGVADSIGILAYLQSQDLAPDYSVQLPTLKPATRATYPEFDAHVLVTNEKLSEMRLDLVMAHEIPGKSGLANLAQVGRERPGADLETLKAVLCCDHRAWRQEVHGEFWFTFDAESNPLVYMAAKVAAVTRSCSVQELATLLAGGLARRTSRYGYPGVPEIAAWIEGSQHFDVRGDIARFRGEAGDLTPIEIAVVELLDTRDSASALELTAELQDRGFDKPNIFTHIYKSPLVFVDKSGGRRAFRMMLASKLPGAIAGDPEPTLYDRMKERLQAIEGTDVDTQVAGRREQGILREWLFRGENTGDCAICGRAFSTGALVVAHKKKRSRCSEAERLDPHIVFPLCVFGCDWLYERGYVTVRGGVVTEGRTAPHETERAMVSSLAGRELEGRWVEGPESYFDNLFDEALAQAAE